MKKMIGIFMILALVVTTTAPSHAMPTLVKTAPTQQASQDHDCHGHGNTADKTAQNDKDTQDKCCDKGMCKCVGGTCHNGLSKIFGNGSDPVLFSYRQGRFGFTDELADSALLEGLKRPPRA